MMRTFRLALAQINPTVGDLDGNTRKIIRMIEEARHLHVDLVAFPEMAIPAIPQRTSSSSPPLSMTIWRPCVEWWQPPRTSR